MAIPENEMAQLIVNEPNPLLKQQAMDTLGRKLDAKFTEFEKTRKDVEEQMLKNYRQYRGVYDPEVIKNLPKNFSRAYPKITRVKVRALLARMMEMLFPVSDRNWSIDPTPQPDIPKDELQAVLEQMQQALAEQYQARIAQLQQQMQAEGQELTEDQLPPEPQLNDEMIEEAVLAWAKDRAERMGVRIDDQLKEIDYQQMVKKVIKSAIIYGLGVLRGPMAKPITRRRWVQNSQGQYEAQLIEEMVPYYEVVSVWDFYPDYSVKTFAHSDGFFERHPMSRHDLNKLKERPDFDQAAIEKHLASNPQGDYKKKSIESELQDADNSSTEASISRMYDVKSFTGFLDGQQLSDMGIKISPANIGKEALVDVWFVGMTVIKAIALPHESLLDYYHTFIFDEEGSETMPIGGSLPEDMRDSQMSVCASTRMLLDNASISTGPQFEINTDLMAPGSTNTDIHAFKKWFREGLGSEANSPAIRTIRMDSHTNELMAIINLFRDFADEESMLPKWALGAGASAGGEALRTAGGTSMLLGASNMTVKDIVRQFDSFTISVLKSHYKWNMRYNPDTSIKGDYQIVARGAASLVAKEVRASTLDQMVATMSPEERAEVNPRKSVEHKLRVRDIAPEEVLFSAEESAENKEREYSLRKAQADSDRALVDARTKKLLTAAAKEVAASAGAGRKTEAQINEIISRTEKNLADADLKGTNAGITFVNTLRSQLEQGQEEILPDERQNAEQTQTTTN